jgi:hypothetical protein
MADIACDTTFLIDLQYSTRSRAGIAARDFLRAHARDRLYLSVIALGPFVSLCVLCAFLRLFLLRHDL